MTSFEAYASRQQSMSGNLEAQPVTPMSATAYSARSLDGRRSATLSHGGSTGQRASPRKPPMLTGMPNFATAAEREQAESYFTDLLSYRSSLCCTIPHPPSV